MAKFTVNPNRYDPYKNFKFRIKWDGKYVAGLNKMTSLKRTTEVIEWREAGDPSLVHKMPGRIRYEAIVLEAGLTQDTAFEAWANQVFNIQGDAAISLAKFRKEVTIEVLNEQGSVALAYRVHRCWVSEYQALPDLDSNAGSVAIVMIKLENEGWERDSSVVEPLET